MKKKNPSLYSQWMVWLWGEIELTSAAARVDKIVINHYNQMLTAKGTGKVRNGRQKIENLVIQGSSWQAKSISACFEYLVGGIC